MKRLCSLVESKYWLIILAVAGTLLRLALIAHNLHSDRFYDELDYDNIANAISHGLGFKDVTYFTAYRAPGQPAFIALIYTIFGHHLAIVEIIEALMLAILPFIVSRLGRAVGLSMLAANIAATLVAFHPALTYASTTLYPTVLTTTALTVGIWLCWESLKRNSGSWAIVAGLALGLAGSATTTFAPFAFLAAVVIAFKKRLRLAILVAFFGLAPALAWMVRNDLVMHDFALATNGGYNLELGANDEATPRSGNWVTLYPHWELGEVQADLLLRQQAVAWIHAHPKRYAELVVLRAFAAFDSVGKPKTAGLHSGVLAQTAGWALLPIVLLGLAGLVIYRRNALAWFTAGALALVIFSSALTIAKPRFRFPCDPMLFVFAVATVARPQRRTAPPSHP